MVHRLLPKRAPRYLLILSHVPCFMTVVGTATFRRWSGPCVLVLFLVWR
jgi:hypothetical protein